MAKFIVSVGGFVTVYRERCLDIYAKDEKEATQKAIDKFIKLQSQKGDCDDAEITYISKTR